MKYFLRWLTLAAFPVLAQSAGVTPITIYTNFDQPPAEATFHVIRAEVERIMAPLGLPLVWTSLKDATGAGAAAELAVVTFRGNCDASDLLAGEDDRTPLGTTALSDGVVIPFAEVDCGRLTAFLRRDLFRMTTKERQSVFGRAVGRVLAHELFHVFTGTTRHRSGVAKAEFTRRELLADPFQFKPEESHSMRVALRAARLIYSRHRTAASPVSGRFLFVESGCAKCHGESGAGTRGGPALRPLHSIDPKTLAGKLANELETMYRRLKSRPPSIPALDDDEIADLASFLNSLE